MGITILGLGPGNPGLITLQVWDLLEEIEELHLRTLHHPVVEHLPAHLKLFSFDYLYEQEEKFEAVYEGIVKSILQLANRPSGVCYAVPGHPLVAEATTPAIIRLAREKNIPVRVFEGISFIEPVCNALVIDPLPYLVIIDALELAVSHSPSFPPSIPAIVAQIHSNYLAAEVKLVLMTVYPDEHKIHLVHAAGTDEQKVETIPLHMIDHSDQIGLLTALYLPPLRLSTSFEQFQEIIAHLRAPDGCPWDREQTHETLRSHLLEETYEALESIESGDPECMREEFGDLLLQIVLHAQIASEQGEFTMADILDSVHNKIVNRHPHVFGGLKLKDAAGVAKNWERIKAEERQNHSGEKAGTLDSVASALPALAQAKQFQQRAERSGFVWFFNEYIKTIINNELFKETTISPYTGLETFFGELLFYIVDLARLNEVDAESSLRKANTIFKGKIEHIESRLKSNNRVLADLSREELLKIWSDANQVYESNL